MAATATPIARLKYVLQGESRIDRVLCVSNQVTVPLANTGNLLTKLGISIQGIEHVRGCIEQVYFMRGNKRAQRKRVIFYLRYRLPILLRWGMQGQVYPNQLGLIEAQDLGPAGKETHDRRLTCSNADKVHGRDALFDDSVLCGRLFHVYFMSRYLTNAMTTLHMPFA